MSGNDQHNADLEKRLEAIRLLGQMNRRQRRNTSATAPRGRFG